MQTITPAIYVALQLPETAGTKDGAMIERILSGAVKPMKFRDAAKDVEPIKLAESYPAGDLRALGMEVLVGHDLGHDEAALHVGVNLASGLGGFGVFLQEDENENEYGESDLSSQRLNIHRVCLVRHHKQA